MMPLKYSNYRKPTLEDESDSSYESEISQAKSSNDSQASFNHGPDKVEPSSDEEQESLYHIEDLALFQVDEEIKTSRNYINRARHQAVIMQECEKSIEDI